MHRLLRHFAGHLLWRQILICALACALPIHGVSTVLLNMLGAQHRHSVVMPDVPRADEGLPSAWSLRSVMRTVVGNGAMEIIDAYHAQGRHLPLAQRVAQVPQQAQATPQAAAHAHAHSLFQRHLHDPHDGTLIVLGEKTSGQHAPGGSPAADAHGAVPLPSDWLPATLAPLATCCPCPSHATMAWQSHVNPPLERPPRA